MNKNRCAIKGLGLFPSLLWCVFFCEELNAPMGWAEGPSLIKCRVDKRAGVACALFSKLLFEILTVIKIGCICGFIVSRKLIIGLRER